MLVVIHDNGSVVRENKTAAYYEKLPRVIIDYLLPFCIAIQGSESHLSHSPLLSINKAL